MPLAVEQQRSRWLLQARLPVDGSYLTDVLPAIFVTAGGLGLGFVAATIAATAGVDDRKHWPPG